MRSILYITVLGMITLFDASPASAQADHFMISLLPYSSASRPSLPSLVSGYSPELVSDGHDPSEIPVIWKPSREFQLQMLFHHTEGAAGWDWQSGWYWADTRPLPIPGATKTWPSLYLWAGAEVPIGDGLIYIKNDSSYFGFPNLTARLRLEYVPESISYNGPWQWNLPLTSSIAFPYYRTSDGLTGYRFSISVTLIPEPSGLLTLAGGCLGAAGLVRRRR